jgi:hypothetical protein
MSRPAIDRGRRCWDNSRRGGLEAERSQGSGRTKDSAPPRVDAQPCPRPPPTASVAVVCNAPKGQLGRRKNVISVVVTFVSATFCRSMYSVSFASGSRRGTTERYGARPPSLIGTARTVHGRGGRKIGLLTTWDLAADDLLTCPNPRPVGQRGSTRGTPIGVACADHELCRAALARRKIRSCRGPVGQSLTVVGTLRLGLSAIITITVRGRDINGAADCLRKRLCPWQPTARSPGSTCRKYLLGVPTGTFGWKYQLNSVRIRVFRATTQVESGPCQSWRESFVRPKYCPRA